MTHDLTFLHVPPGKNAACTICGLAFDHFLEAEATPCVPRDAIAMIARCAVGQGCVEKADAPGIVLGVPSWYLEQFVTT